MRQEFDYKKTAVIAGLAVAAVGLGVGLWFFVGNGGNHDENAALVVQQTETESPVVVPEIETKVVQAETETVLESSAVQEESETETEAVTVGTQEPVTTAVTKAAVTESPRLRSSEQLIPSAETPADTAAAVPVENTDKNGECQPEHTQAVENVPQGGEKNDSGAVYFPGFGYVEDAGSATGETIDTDGDWNRQIGTMD